MVVWLVFGRGMMEMVDAGMCAVEGATPSSGPGEEVIEDAMLAMAD